MQSRLARIGKLHGFDRQEERSSRHDVNEKAITHGGLM
jgi:hypothetical protein